MPVFPEPPPLASHGPARIIAMATRRAASARPRRRSTSARRWPSTAARCCSSTSTRRVRCRSAWASTRTSSTDRLQRAHGRGRRHRRRSSRRPRRRAWTCCRPTSTCPRPRSSWSARWPARRSLARALRRSSRLRLHPDRLPAVAGPAHDQRADRRARRARPAGVRVLQPARRRAAAGHHRQGAGAAQPALEVDGILATMYDTRTLHSPRGVARVVRGVRRQGVPDRHHRDREVPRVHRGRGADHLLRPRTPARRPTASWPAR